MASCSKTFVVSSNRNIWSWILVKLLNGKKHPVFIKKKGFFFSFRNKTSKVWGKFIEI